MTLFQVRPATLDNLDTLVSFTLAEALEAEGLDLVPETSGEACGPAWKTRPSPATGCLKAQLTAR